MSFGLDSAKAEAELRRGLSDTVEGTCVRMDWANNLVVVNIGGGEIVMPLAGNAPWPNDKVRVIYVGQKPLCLGVRPRANLGTVAVTPSAGKVEVTGDDGQTYRYPYAANTTFSSGQRVLMDHGGRIVVCQISSEPDKEIVAAPPPAAGSGPVVTERTFYATDSANFRGGAFQSNAVEISDSRSAFYYYGTQIADSIPDGATILDAYVTLTQEWDNVPGTASRMGTHGDAGRGGQPGLSGAVSVPGGSRTVSLMGAFADQLKTGAAKGLGFYSGNGWRRYGSAASSGQVYVRWQI